MKRIILTLFLFISGMAFAQIPVTDVAANSNLAIQVSQGSQQLSQLMNSYKVLKEGADKFKQINGYVQQMGQLQNIINQQRSAISNANMVVRKAREKNIRVDDLSGLLNQIQGSIRTVQALLQNGMFKMTDAERINLMEGELKKAKSVNASIRAKLIKLSY